MNELPTYHGPCPYCGSAISVVIKDCTTVARCSHRGCGARGPIMRSTARAVELFRAGRHVKAGSGAAEASAPVSGLAAAYERAMIRAFAESIKADANGGVCEKCGGSCVEDSVRWDVCTACTGTGRKR